LADALAAWARNPPAVACGLYGGLRRSRLGGRGKPDARRQPARIDPRADHRHRHGDRHGSLRPCHGLWHCAPLTRGARCRLAHVGSTERWPPVNDLLLQASRISVRRNGRLTLQPTDFAVRAGETVGIYGPNGAGKSTLLQALAGLLRLSSRTITLARTVLALHLTSLALHRPTP